MEAAFSSGAAAQKFAKMVSVLGGPSDLLEKPERYLEAAPVVRPVFATSEGAVVSIDTRAVGVAVVAMRGGRVNATDEIDPVVGFTDLAMVGEFMDSDRPLGTVHARTADQADAAADALVSAYQIGQPANVPDDNVLIETIEP